MPDTPDGAADRLSELLATHCRALQEWLRAGAAGRAPTPDAALAAWRAAHPDTGETFERTLAQGLRFVGLVEELLRLGAAAGQTDADAADWQARARQAGEKGHVWRYIARISRQRVTVALQSVSSSSPSASGPARARSWCWCSRCPRS